MGYDSNSSDDDSDEEEETLNDPGGPSLSMAYSVPDTGDALDRMASELDTLVRFIRRGAETLGGEYGFSSAFKVLSFSLEDWDL
jgi:gamma-tubulin complex component 5